MSDNATKAVDIKYFSRCLEDSKELKEGRECGGLRFGNIVEFEILIKVFKEKTIQDQMTIIVGIKLHIFLTNRR